MGRSCPPRLCPPCRNATPAAALGREFAAAAPDTNASWIGSARPRGSTAIACALAIGGTIWPGCGRKAESGTAAGPALAVSGAITMLPLSEALARRFREQGGAEVPVYATHTAGGFAALCAGDVAIVAASRPIERDENDACADANVEYVELPVAFDGVAVIVHADNRWVDSISLGTLHGLWAPEAAGESLAWSDLEPDGAAIPITLYGLPRSSGTWAFFTRAVVGTAYARRSDYVELPDADAVAFAVAADRSGLGLVDLATLRSHEGTIRALEIDEGPGRVAPTSENAGRAHAYPLARPLLLYVARAELARPDVLAFATLYLEHAGTEAARLGFSPLPEPLRTRARERLAHRTKGSAFGADGPAVGISAEELLRRR